ncbi:MAG: hypothetical protein V8T31_10925 [Lachnospiraceae bacterium]
MRMQETVHSVNVHLCGFLDGGCSSPVAAHAKIKEDQILLLGLYYDEMNGGYLKGNLLRTQR